MHFCAVFTLTGVKESVKILPASHFNVLFFDIMENFLDSITGLFDSLAWPAIAILFLIRFDVEIRGLLEKGFRLKAGDKELEVPGRKEEAKKVRRKQENAEEAKEKFEKFSDPLERSYFFEKMYRLIFTSQLAILNAAYSNSNGEVNESFVQNTYFGTIWKSEGTFYPFNEYVSFLTKNDFLIHNEQKRLYKISSRGREFMSYLKENGIPLWKGSDLF